MTANPIWVVQYEGAPFDALFDSTRGLGFPVVVDSSDGNLYYFKLGDGVKPVGHAFTRYVVANAQENTSATGPVSTALAFTPAADSKLYIIKGQLGLRCTDAAKVPKLYVTFPSNIEDGFISMKSATSTSADTSYHGAASGTVSLTLTGTTTNTTYPVLLDATFRTKSNTSGNFTIGIGLVT